jgi:hypothetical protein
LSVTSHRNIPAREMEAIWQRVRDFFARRKIQLIFLVRSSWIPNEAKKTVGAHPARLR